MSRQQPPLGLREHRTRIVALGALLITGCAAAPPSPASDPPAGGKGAEGAPKAEAPPSEPTGTPGSAGAAPESPADARPEPREIRYLVTSEGLEIRVEGVHFLANATAVRVRDGWGLKLDLSAVSKDDATHSLLTPDNGPLALAGVVQRGTAREEFKDERQGGDEQIVEPGKTLKFSRSWPPANEKPLKAKDSVELEVGLWGIGPSERERRPVQNFFHASLAVDSGKPAARIAPPKTATKE